MIDSKKTVAIVDDHASVRRSLERLFRTVGMESLTYTSAEEFLQAGRPPGIACLVLDVRLPGSSGIELQDRLRKSSIEIPIVFITGHGDVPLTVRAMKFGAVDFLPKPFDDSVLIEAVERALARDEARLARQQLERSAVELYGTLTPREREVFELVVEGLLNKQIAMQLGVSEKTVKVHRGQVMRKLKANSVPDLVRTHAIVGGTTVAMAAVSRL